MRPRPQTFGLPSMARDARAIYREGRFPRAGRTGAAATDWRRVTAAHLDGAFFANRAARSRVFSSAPPRGSSAFAGSADVLRVQWKEPFPQCGTRMVYMYPV